MKLTRALPILLAAVLAAAACSPESPDTDTVKIQQPLQAYSSPYGSSPVSVFVGTLYWFGSHYQTVAYQRQSDSNCTFYLPTNVDGGSLTDNVDATGGSGNDYMRTVDGNPVTFYCSNVPGNVTVSLVKQAGHYVALHGGAGNDYMILSGDSSTINYVYGDDGNDSIDGYISKGYVSGGNGDDKIRMHITSDWNTSIYGDAGKDCLQFDSQPSAINAYSCGANPPGCSGNVATCDSSTHYLGTGCQWIAGTGACN